ncbi:hypothetical protein WBP06_08550 [Novosphingobium sp. BL-8H]|uniref:hypothetical protein n=1 Tax=Novosphingobium sp. BL-8H TaxID=3127640 RepID=UPI0037570883
MTIPKGKRRLPGVVAVVAVGIVVVVGGLAWADGGRRQVRDIVQPVKVPDQKVTETAE